MLYPKGGYNLTRYSRLELPLVSTTATLTSNLKVLNLKPKKLHTPGTLELNIQGSKWLDNFIVQCKHHFPGAAYVVPFG